MAFFRPRPTQMAVTRQQGRPSHLIDRVQQAVAQVQVSSSAALAEDALVDLGGDYAGTPGALQAALDDFQTRISALETP